MLHSELPIPHTSRYKAAILFTIKVSITYTIVYWTISPTPALPGKFPEQISGDEVNNSSPVPRFDHY